jgi:HEAT repeat protein
VEPENLLEDLADPEVSLNSKLLIGLGHLDREETAQLAAAWTEIDPQRKEQVLTALATLLEDNVELNFDQVFKTALRDETASVRVAGLRGLFEYEGRDIIPVIAGLLRVDEDIEVRREAAIALGRYALSVEMENVTGRDAALVKSALIESVEDTEEDAWVRSRAIEALGAISGDETENLIESVYGEDDLWMRIGAIDAMGRSCDETWLPIIADEMKSDAAEMRFAAAFAAGLIGSYDSITDLTEMTTDEDQEVRIAAVQSLGEIGGPNARVILTNLLYEGDESLREAIEEAISALAIDEDPFRMR